MAAGVRHGINGRISIGRYSSTDGGGGCELEDRVSVQCVQCGFSRHQRGTPCVFTVETLNFVSVRQSIDESWRSVPEPQQPQGQRPGKRAFYRELKGLSTSTRAGVREVKVDDLDQDDYKFRERQNV